MKQIGPVCWDDVEEAADKIRRECAWIDGYASAASSQELKSAAGSVENLLDELIRCVDILAEQDKTVAGCSCGAKFMTTEEAHEHVCPLDGGNQP